MTSHNHLYICVQVVFLPSLRNRKSFVPFCQLPEDFTSVLGSAVFVALHLATSGFCSMRKVAKKDEAGLDVFPGGHCSPPWSLHYELCFLRTLASPDLFCDHLDMSVKRFCLWVVFSAAPGASLYSLNSLYSILRNLLKVSAEFFDLPNSISHKKEKYWRFVSFGSICLSSNLRRVSHPVSPVSWWVQEKFCMCRFGVGVEWWNRSCFHLSASQTEHERGHLLRTTLFSTSSPFHSVLLLAHIFSDLFYYLYTHKM